MNGARVVISGNCQAPALGQALTVLRPHWDVCSFAPWDLSTTDFVGTAKQRIQEADLWLQMPLSITGSLGDTRCGGTTLRIPALVFSAFQPDLVYATTSDGVIFRGITDYHSAIGLWAWKRGLTPSDFSSLLTADVMEKLGYFEFWTPSVQSLAEAFTESDLSFGRFWSSLKREGVFMHAVNHPRPPAIAALARAIVERVDADDSVWSLPIERILSDTLGHIVWPVYPPIAMSVGECGSYNWRVGDRVFADPTTWAKSQWEAYGDVPRDSVYSPRLADPQLDEVLSQAIASQLGDG